MSKCSKLKELLNSYELEFLMECHDGMSAKIIEETGFKGGWISGLSLSASHGVRDRNELSFKEVADACYYICSRVDIPMLLDMDTGYGDNNTACTAVRMIESAGVAGVCIEDKLFPKRNSFLNNSGNDLEDPKVHASKIKAIHDAAYDRDFVVVARTEAFISGLGVDEALRRAEIYADAGADAILVHSKISSSSEIRKFMSRWNKNTPIVIVPTKYYSTPTEEFRDLGISTVIWANHNLRSAIKSMEETSRIIYNSESLINVEDEIVPVSEVFRLQGDSKSESKEFNNLSATHGSSIILTAGCKGDCKTLYQINGTSLVRRQLDIYRSRGIYTSTIVCDPKYRTNLSDETSEYKSEIVLSNESTEVGSLSAGLSHGDTDLPLIISYGDLAFKSYIIDRMKSDDDIVFAIDKEYEDGEYNEYVTSETFDNQILADKCRIDGCVAVKSCPKIVGSFVGIVRVNTAKGLSKLIKYVNESKDYRFSLVISKLAEDENLIVSGVFINHDDWRDCNSLEDTAR